MCEACSQIIDHNASERTQWLQRRVYDAYIKLRPQMGASDDTTDGHRLAAMTAKLHKIHRLLEEVRTTYPDSQVRVLEPFLEDIEAVVETLV